MKIIAVSDVSGGMYNPNGLDIPAIEEYLAGGRGRLLSGLKLDGTVSISNDELLTLETDVLIPAALENQINESNADKIQAKLIVEAANGPTSAEADVILQKRGIPVVPDILANAGGVIASYFEWVQNSQSLSWTEKELNDRLEEILDRSFEEVWNITQEKKVTLRMGAYLIAVGRVVKAKKERGIWP